ncbi:MAG: NAD-dependent succinate-semialdehyde dehydrogenase [Verrucomicrobia bacterium]|nr:NAD-dependent succinate-semialdehyde dehydrogenase [Verrucomicrobiota bacterium]
MKTYPLYLNGEWLNSDTTLPVVNPASGETFAQMSAVDRPAVAVAIKNAHKALAGWRHLTAKGRGELLHKIASELDRRREEIARIITLENGKPIAQSQGEVAMSVDHLRWFAEEGRRVYGRIVPHQVEGKRHLVIKSPIGVVGAICPWNFPLVLAVRKIAPALVAGCPVILKPASQTPLTAVALAECVAKAELPKGVFQLVVGDATEIGAEFLANPLCRKITFTGSTEVGRKLIAGAAAGVKPLSLELGGNAPVLVFDDCSLETALAGVMMAKFRNSGQSCIAANRIYVQRQMYPGFLRALTDRVKAMETGDGMDPQSDIGPLINAGAVERAHEHVQDAVNGGGRLMCGGSALRRPGYFFEPTVIGNVSRNALCMFEETFAPIAPITPFETEAEVVELANNTIHGLAAYVFTRDMDRMFRMAESLEAGIIGVNDGLPTTSQCPFGGVKQSGWGRELGYEGIEAFLETKHVSIEME